VKIVMGDDGNSKGIAFIDFETKEDADDAIKLTGKKIAGKPVRISASKRN
jgi:RNA recognition motif-containing protein